MHRIRRSGWLLIAVAVLVSTGARGARGQEGDPAKKRLESSPRHHEWVDVKTKAGRIVRAFLAFPEVDKPVPGVLVIHENRGLNDWARGVADQLAEAGYVALAPDLLSQTGPDKGGTESYASGDAAREGIYRLPPEQVLADLDACFEHLRKLDATSRTVAVAGFCWGGAQSFRYAAHNPELAAAFVFYGSAPERDEFEKIKAPVFGFYGGNDQRITGQVSKVAEEMKKLHKRFDPVTYEGAGHGFMRAGEEPDADAPNRDARDQAWKRWKELLAKLDAAGPATRPAKPVDER